jgi:CubicO group peptidase (beta-lactamase class C family)
MLGFLVDGDAVLGDVQDGWRAFRPYHMNGAAYGGLIGTADGFARYLQALLTPSNTLLSPQSRRTLFTENILAGGKPSGMSVSWFMGSVAGEQYFDHAGGGGGYYAELRLYPRIGRGSVLLMNRTGIRNERILDKVDRAFVEESSRRR